MSSLLGPGPDTGHPAPKTSLFTGVRPNRHMGYPCSHTVSQRLHQQQRQDSPISVFLQAALTYLVSLLVTIRAGFHLCLLLINGLTLYDLPREPRCHVTRLSLRHTINIQKHCVRALWSALETLPPGLHGGKQELSVGFAP